MANEFVARRGIISLGGITYPQVTIGSTYTITDDDYMVAVSGGTFTINLPTAVGVQGKLYVIKNNGTGTITVDPNGSETIDGSTTVTLIQNDSIQITSDGTNWTSLSYNFNTIIENYVTVGLSGSSTDFNSVKDAVDSITGATPNSTWEVRVYPGLYIEDTITMKSWITVRGGDSTTTILQASNPNNSVFIMADQSMVQDMQIQGSSGTSASSIVYSSSTTPQTNAIAYVENVRFGTNYTHAKVVGTGGGNCIIQCSNVKYGGYTDASLQKSFDVGFHVTSGSSGGIGRMQLRNVTSTNGGVSGTDNNQIFALADVNPVLILNLVSA